MKHTLRRILLFVVALFAAALFLALASGAETASGECGQNLSWSLDTDSGMLLIVGKGNMETSTWRKYSASIRTVIVSDGVTGISDSAFRGCSALTSVSLPSSVRSVAENAFEGCDSLVNVFLDFPVRAGNSTWGYELLTPKQKIAYYLLYLGCEKLMDSSTSVTSSALVTFYTSSGLITTPEDFKKVMFFFDLDNPAYFFFRFEVMTYVPGKAFVATIDNSFLSGAVRAGFKASVDAMTREFEDYIAGAGNELKKAALIHDFLVGRCGYAYKADGKTPIDEGWAHSILGVAEARGAVCEGFSESFRYFCNLEGITSLSVMGMTSAGIGHEWNYVFLGGQWYGVDITWDVLGKGRDKYSYFALGEKSFASGRVPGVYYVNYDNLPPLSATDLELFPSEAPHEIRVLAVTATTVTVFEREGYEYSIDGKNYQTSPIFEGLKPGTAYFLTQRIAATGTHLEGYATEPQRVETSSKKPCILEPTAPTVDVIGSESISLVHADGYEYSMDGIAWQKEPVFYRLSAATVYTFYRRFAETVETLPSEKSPGLTVQTAGRPIDSGSETPTPTPEVPASSVPGDMNGDGKLNDRDALYLCNYLRFPQSNPLSVSGDTNGDGKITSDDVSYLLRHIFSPQKYPLR